MPGQVQTGSRSIVPTHLQPTTVRGGRSALRSSRFATRRSGTCCKAGWAGLRVNPDGMENLAPNTIQFPDSPAHSESLYRLHYPSCHLCLALSLRWAELYVYSLACLHGMDRCNLYYISSDKKGIESSAWKTGQDRISSDSHGTYFHNKKNLSLLRHDTNL